MEAIEVLRGAADEARAEQVRLELQARMASRDKTTGRRGGAAVNGLESRIGATPPLTSGATPTPAQAGIRPPQPTPAETARTQLISDPALGQTTKQAEPAAARVQIQKLKSAEIIERRYKDTDHTRRGALGTVLLIE